LGREKQGNLCWGVINWDDPRGELLLDKTEAEVITYGIRNKAEVSAKEIELDLSGIRARIVTPRGNFFIKSPLLGELNLYNILAAVGVGISQKLSLKEIKGGIEKVKEVPGRLERIENNDGILILIDYAHTSDALEKLLSAVEGFASGRVISVFGCGGDRDRKKRPLMGATAARHSDLTVITSDNPRSEDPLRIISEIEEGIEKCQARRYYPRDLPGGFSQKGYVIVTDRKEAIKLAINLAESGDLVTIAGKGHENYQIIGNKRIPFDDQAEVREALARKETRKLN
jgi:UDP-N-acetylmuramoyl-L-alanyl-D-glutamate--2,6-diaminopimelate ligase